MILSSSERWEPFPEDNTFLESVLAVKTAGKPFFKPSLWIFSHFYVEYFLYQALDSGFAPSGQAITNHRAGTPFLSSSLYCESTSVLLLIMSLTDYTN